ncbi:MAG: ABC transporter substrate-binding protein [Deltaproteobacteria bacterium]|nr:ABC transporter substrate-binding protein [Deltaproteobacteria bacterium]
MKEAKHCMKSSLGIFCLCFFIGIFFLTPLVCSAAEKVLKIGAIFPLSGKGAVWGIAAQRAITIVQKEINGRGGLNVAGDKYRLEIIWEDDKFNAATGRMAAEKLVNRDGVKFILGSQSSAVLLAVQPITEPKKILFFLNSFAKEVLSPDKPYSYRMVLTSNEILPAMYPWLVKNYPKAKTVAFIEPNDASGWSVEKDCRRNAEKNNLKIVFSQFYERGTSDFYPLLNKLILQNPDVIDFTGAPPGDQALIVKQARELGFKGKTFAATTIDPPEFCKIAGTQNAEGHISNTHDLLGAFNTEAQKKYVEDYLAQFGKPFDPVTPKYTLYLEILAQAIEKAGSLDTTKVKEILDKTEEWNSIYGKARFGGKEYYGIKHQIVTPVYISELINGKLVNRGTMMPVIH